MDSVTQDEIVDNKTEKEEVSDVTRVVDTILEAGFHFSVTVSRRSFWHRFHLFPSERKFIIYPLTLATLLEISKEVVNLKLITDDLDIEKGDSFFNLISKNVIDNKDILLRIVELSVTNRGKNRPSNRLMRFLGKNLNPEELWEILSQVVRQMDTNHFLACSVLMKNSLNIIKTAPKKVESKKQTKQPEISGVSSE